MRLYPKVEVAKQSFVGVKRVTVPNQSMSLREIIKRFVRHESLPVSKDGVYEERFGDLEKMSKGDIVDQMENVERFRELQKKYEVQEAKKASDAAAKKKELEDKAFEERIAARFAKESTPAGGTPIKSPPLQGS